MASNNGQKLQVFGLGFAQHDNRNMQQVLRHYNRMPDNPGNRTSLFVELSKLARELSADEAKQDQVQQVTSWMQNGGTGAFPLGQAPPPVHGRSRTRHQNINQAAQHAAPTHAVQMARGRYGLGRLLWEDPAPVDEEPPERIVHESDRNELDMDVDMAPGVSDEAASGGLPSEQSDQGASEAQEQSDNEAIDSQSDDDMNMDHNEQYHPHSRFLGRGHTLNDMPEPETADDGASADAIDQTTFASATNNHVNVGRPRLHAHQGWRGNNVMGLGRGMDHGHGPGRGMINQVPRRRRAPVQGPNGWGINHEEEEDGFDRIGNHVVFGRGRTLNDPAPEPFAEQEDQLNAAQQDPQAALDDSSDEEMEDSVAEDTPDQPDDDGEEIECPICIGSYPRNNFPKRGTITDLCDHPDMACLQCLQASISEILKRGALHILACPICPQKLVRRDIKEYATKQDYKRFMYLKTQAEIPGHWISCTNTACGGSQPHDAAGVAGPMMVCKHCQFATCARHRLPWHDGQTCDEFDMDPAQIERLEEEEATAKLLAMESTSICPKCGQGVTKTEGCDHMMCQCGTEWCYICSCSWENILRLGATAHATFCLYHPNKTNLTKSQADAARKRIMGLVHGGEVSAELTRARDAFRQKRREEMRPKLLEAAEARQKQQQQKAANKSGEGAGATRKRKVKLVAPWEEGGRTKKAL